jgi:hypothetical protein
MSNTNNTKITVFLDYLGRSILGELLESTDTVLKVKNPVILHVPPSPDNSGRMSVQLYPIFFREFLADKTEDVVFDFLKDKITQSSIEALDFRLQAQYSHMFNKNNEFGASPQPPLPNQQETIAQETVEKKEEVIKLFDE